MSHYPEFYPAMEIIYSNFWVFKWTVSNLSVWSTYLTNKKWRLTKEGRMLSAVARFKKDLLKWTELTKKTKHDIFLFDV